ncbi:MAG TPA: hypothetical protein PKA53_00855, partial [Sphingobacterium sp.]|nr:hypothetical protein [Sphingobacterium sp.]
MWRYIKFLFVFTVVIPFVQLGYTQESTAQSNVYQILPYNEDFVKVKHRILRSLKLTREAKKLNVSGKISAVLELDEMYRGQSVHLNSSVGYGVDEALRLAVEKANGKNGRDFSKMKELVRGHHLTFNVPFYIFDYSQTSMSAAPLMMGAGGGVAVGVGIPITRNRDFIMVADFYHQNAADSIYDYKHIFPQGSFEKYVEHFAAAYIKKKTTGLFTGGFYPGQYVVTFKVDQSGHLKDIKTTNVHQRTNTMSKFLRKNEDVFALNSITYEGQ